MQSAIDTHWYLFVFEHQKSDTKYERDLLVRSPPPHFLILLFMAHASWKKTFEHCRRIACLFIWGYLCWERRFEGVCLRSSGSLSKHSFRAGWGCHQEMVEHVQSDCLISFRRHLCCLFLIPGFWRAIIHN